METLIGASKILAIMSSFLVFFSNSPVKLAPPQMCINDNQVIIHEHLLYGFQKELVDLIHSGTKVTIRFELALRQKNEVIKACEITHSVVYDVAKQEYTVSCSEREKDIQTKNEREMRKRMSNVDTAILSAHEVIPGKDYCLQITAELLPIKIRALRGGEFLLSALWDYKKPRAECRVVLKP
ncbi:MAG: hypothetical protein QME49_04580 [bacterium]|nr:hypothetical protein [bacterium]